VANKPPKLLREVEAAAFVDAIQDPVTRQLVELP
jgi:hypothetical protein